MSLYQYAKTIDARKYAFGGLFSYHWVACHIMYRVAGSRTVISLTQFVILKRSLRPSAATLENSSYPCPPGVRKLQRRTLFVHTEVSVGLRLLPWLAVMHPDEDVKGCTDIPRSHWTSKFVQLQSFSTRQTYPSATQHEPEMR